MSSAQPGGRVRVASVDVVRGLIMVLMALDHVRDFFGVPGERPTDVAHASPALFFTRWVTHFCAPVFFLLTGTGARLSLTKKGRRGLSWFLLTRGVWLIVLELTLVRCLAYQFNVDYRVTMLLVLWALGWAMIVLAALVWLPLPAIIAFGLALVAGHDLLDGVQATNPLAVVLHGPGFVVNRPGFVVFAGYPLVPWIGVTALGYALGATYAWDPARRRAFLLRLGAALTAAFVVIRLLDAYGDPAPWERMASGTRTALSFLDTTKYPPSLSFLLMTLGPAVALLGAVEGWSAPWLRPVLVVGRVPLFYYVVHFALIHALATIACLAQAGSARWMFESPDAGHYPFSAPPGWGFSLPVVYVLWAAVVAAMYPFCRWFARVKATRTDAWLSYL